MAHPSLEAIENLTRRSAWVRALARQLVADQDLAEDVAQDAVLVALASTDGSSRGPGWLAGVVRNLAANVRRRTTRRTRAESCVAPGPEPRSAAETALIVEQQRLLAEAVLGLEAPFKDVVLLRFYDDLPRREIARRLQVPIATVNSRLTRALAKLRARLDQSHGNDRRTWITALAPIVWDSHSKLGWSVGALTMSNKKVALAALVALLVGVGIWRGAGDPVEGDPMMTTTARSTALPGTDRPDETITKAPHEVEPDAVDLERTPVAQEPAIEPSRQIRLRVIDGPTGAAVPDARVRYADAKLSRSTAFKEALRGYRVRGGDSFELAFGLGLGRSLALDANASCEFELVGPLGQLMAVHDHRRGFHLLQAYPGSEVADVTLALWPVQTTRVRVVDAGGSPLADVPVWLKSTYSGRTLPVALRFTRSPDGIVEHSWFRGLTGTGAPFESPEVSLAFPLAHEVAEPQDTDHPTDVTLICPAVSKVHVIVTVHGAPAPDGTTVFLRAARPTRDQNDEMAAALTAIAVETKDGTATFWPVGLDVPLIASFQLSDEVSFVEVQADGPTRANEPIRIALSTDLENVIVRGRLLNSDGVPLANRMVTARFRRGTVEGPWLSIETDEQGGFERPFAIDLGHSDDVQVEFAGERVGHGSVATPLSIGTPGTGDVGEVRLPAEAPFVDGIVVDESGEPLAGVVVWVKERSENGSADWDSTDGYLVPTTAVDGRFVIQKCATRAPQLGLLATVRGPFRHETVGFARGARDVRIVMQAAASLTVRIVLDDALPADRIRVEAWPESLGPPTRRSNEWVHLSSGADGRFSAHGIEPGSYTIVATLPSAQEIAHITGVALRRGETTVDPRLSPIDLRGRVRTVALSVDNDDGERLDANVSAWLGDGDSGRRPVRGLHSDRLLMFATAEGVSRLLVEHDGYFPAVLDTIDSTLRVTLHRGLSVTLEAANVPALATPFSLHVALVPVQPQAPAIGMPARERETIPMDRAVEAGARPIEFRVSEPGLYRVRVFVRRTGSRGSTQQDVSMEPTTEVYVAEGRSTSSSITVDPVAVQTAIAALER